MLELNPSFKYLACSHDAIVSVPSDVDACWVLAYTLYIALKSQLRRASSLPTIIWSLLSHLELLVHKCGLISLLVICYKFVVFDTSQFLWW